MAAAWASRFDEFHERAIAQIGLTDFGDRAYHEGLRALLDAIDDRPIAAGPKTEAAERLVLGPLVSRLHTEAQWKANPLYRARGVPAPVVIIGVARTGTTALHNLLSQDPQFQGIESWLTAAPLVRPPREAWAAHPQYQSVCESVDAMFAAAPDAMKAHGVRADDVDECLVPMTQSFCCNWFPSQLDIPLYDRWFLAADEAPSFRRYKDVLRLVGLNDDRRWLLKNPSHAFGIEALLAVFPDACVVQTHRHPAASLPSLINLLDNVMMAYTGEGVDRARRLARETEFYAEAVRRTMAAQDRHPERFVNVLQRDLRRDPLGVVREIYDKFGLDLSPEAEAAMTGWAVRNAENAQGGHTYAKLAEERPILEAFAPYLERFAL